MTLERGKHHPIPLEWFNNSASNSPMHLCLKTGVLDLSGQVMYGHLCQVISDCAKSDIFRMSNDDLKKETF